MADPGVGAWQIPRFYGLKQGPIPPEHDQRVRWANIAIQNELIRQGFMERPSWKLDGGVGPRYDSAIRAFQRSWDLKPDGLVGPSTAGRLWVQQFVWWQVVLGIPGNLVMGLARLESGFDPGAVGRVDERDRGLCQFNRRWWPQVSDEMAFSDVPGCVALAAQNLAEAHERYGSWDCAIAAHNNPSKARAWQQSGEAPDEQIAEYVQLVRRSAARPL